MRLPIGADHSRSPPTPLLVVLVVMVGIVMVVVAILPRRVVDVPVVVPEGAHGENGNRHSKSDQSEECCNPRGHVPTAKHRSCRPERTAAPRRAAPAGRSAC